MASGHVAWSPRMLRVSTNHKTDGLHLIAEDRRHFVSWTDLTPDDFEADYWSRIYRCYESENG